MNFQIISVLPLGLNVGGGLGTPWGGGGSNHLEENPIDELSFCIDRRHNT